MKAEEVKCCTPDGKIKRYKDCIGCDKKPLELNQNNMKQKLSDYGINGDDYSIEYSNPQTAVEWLINQLFNESTVEVTKENNPSLFEVLEQAKAMEKEQKNQMYNEIEVLQLLLKLHQTKSFDNLKEWFEQNKKITFKSE